MRISTKSQEFSWYIQYYVGLNECLLIAFLATKFLNKDWETKWKRLLGEYTFNGLMFSGYIVGVALGLQFLYGFSILFSILFLGLYIGYMVLFVFKPEFFGEFTSFFK